MSLDKLPVNLFDLVLVAVLVLGVLRGRKNGMSEELLNVLKWFALLVACAVAYEPLGRLFSQSSGVLSLLTCYIMAYNTAALREKPAQRLISNCAGHQ